MKKILVCIISIMLSISMLVGCGSNTPSDNNNPGTPSQPNTPTITEPELKPIGEYFASNAKVKYYTINKNITDQAGNTKSFENLVDRQIDILANDILYRLVAVYGTGTEGLTTETGNYGEPAFGLIDPLTESVFTDGTNKALISNYELISLPFEASSNTFFTNYKYADGTIVKYNDARINEAASYAILLKSGAYRTDEPLTTYFNNENAINGGLYWDDANGFNRDLGFYLDLSWNWSYENLNIDILTGATSVYTQYKNRYIDNLKTAIANILLSGNSAGKSYQTAINEIVKLGFTESDRVNIKNFVLNEVIGTSLVLQDDDRKPNETVISFNTQLTEQEHHYKAYSLLIPEILNRAFENTFSGTETSLYLNAQKIVLSDEIEMNSASLNSKNFESIKLTAKGSMPLTELIFSVSGEGVEYLEITYSLYKDESSMIEGANDIAVTISANGKFELDFSTFKELNINEGGYIMIAFKNSSDKVFNISFDGYYNK